MAERSMDISERQGTNLSFILLDREKAFDKIDQAKLLEVLHKLQLPNDINEDATFKVVNRDAFSSYKRQNSGIHQACPLSTYLFGIVMSAIVQDIKRTLYTLKQLAPIPGINYAEMLYADDTLLFETHTHTLNLLLQEVQTKTAKYNMYHET